MSFKKVDEEQLRNDVENALTSIEPLFQQSSTIEEMETHIDEIKEIEGVEDVWREGNDIVVKFQDWNTLFITYPIYDEIEESDTKELTNSLNKISKMQHAPLREDGEPLSVVIAFQPAHDKDFSGKYETMKSLKKKFSLMGFVAHFVPDEESGEIIDRDFYKSRMFDYNIVILTTHGHYNSITGKHSFDTQEGVEWWESIPIYPSVSGFTSEFFDMDDVGYSLGTIKDGIPIEHPILYKCVNEDYIKKSSSKFMSAGPHLLFFAVCSSLKGDGNLEIVHNGITDNPKGSDAVAQIFFDKNADIFIGYNEKSGHNSFTANQYFYNMLQGESQEKAFFDLPATFKRETDIEGGRYQAELIDLFNDKSKYKNLKSFFFFKTQTESKTENEVVNEVNNRGTIELKGKTSLGSIEESKIKFGFRLGTKPDVDAQNDLQDIFTNNVSDGNEAHIVDFSTEVIAETIADPGKTVYYRAFTYDDIHYNWGEERSFTLPAYSNLQIVTTSLSLNVGQTKTVNITSGSGSYKIEIISGKNAVVASLNGNVISVTGKTAGNATIKVTDTKTGQTATIEVAVTAGGGIAYTSCPDANHPHWIDLGLPSGTKWACCNAGTHAPEGYSLWLCDPSYFTFDEAQAYNPPSLDQIQELLDNTTSTWTTQNDMNGRLFTGNNGGSVFLPAAGFVLDNSLGHLGVCGFYWSSTSENGLFFNSYQTSLSHYPGSFGQCVRPVLRN